MIQVSTSWSKLWKYYCEFWSHKQIEFWPHDHNFDLMKKLFFDLMKFDLMTISWSDRKSSFNIYKFEVLSKLLNTIDVTYYSVFLFVIVVEIPGTCSMMFSFSKNRGGNPYFFENSAGVQLFSCLTSYIFAYHIFLENLQRGVIFYPNILLSTLSGFIWVCNVVFTYFGLTFKEDKQLDLFLVTFTEVVVESGRQSVLLTHVRTFWKEPTSTIFQTISWHVLSLENKLPLTLKRVRLYNARGHLLK
jgi:hypothetical protein